MFGIWFCPHGDRPINRPKNKSRSFLPLATMKLSLTVILASAGTSWAFVVPRKYTFFRSAPASLQMSEKPAGSFFNQIPEDSGDDSEKKAPPETPLGEKPFDFDKSVKDMLRARKAPSKASMPSTVNGQPTSGKGFGRAQAPQKPYIAIGEPDKPVNDVTKPEYDDQGYTLYQNEQTGEKSRVFEALVEYPCDFTMKIVGANEGGFVDDVVQIVADSCEVTSDKVPFSTREMGKWTSVTVKAPVENAEMLYRLYENVDRDPRVKFKF